MSDDLGALAARFPQRAASIRRLARDPTWRSICDDYRDACCALQHWEAAGRAAPERVAEYRQMVAELEAEALALLEALGEL